LVYQFSLKFLTSANNKGRELKRTKAYIYSYVEL